ncbi:MAG: hypothetical protein HAW67_06955 [Endozoicomonadaceae bacterium]|nr:hypothetical protein [Endozoicomonadaceae bacterium]
MFKSFFKWAIRPSIFNVSKGASNPFHDAGNIFKVIRDEHSKNVDSDQFESSHIELKHKEMVKCIKKVTEKERFSVAQTQYSFAFFCFISWVTFTALGYFLFDSQADSTFPIVYVIINKLWWMLIISFVTYTLTTTFMILNYLWRASMLKNPDNTVNFMHYVCTPKKWVTFNE